ncbi:MAG: hypothetical protein WBQ86_21315 [Candidatus Binatus sp.]
MIFGVAISLPTFMLVSPLASLLMVRPITPADWGIPILGAAIAIGWRVFGSRGVSP